jgi:hypothetical protein
MDFFEGSSAALAALVLLDFTFVIWLVQRARRPNVSPRLFLDERLGRRSRGL